MAAKADHHDQQAADSVKQHPVADDELHRASGRASDADEPDSTSDNTGDAVADATAAQYDVEHLATFSTTASSHETPNGEGEFLTNLNKLNNRQPARQQQQHQSASEPRVALQRLFELEKLSGIWTQRMQIQLKDDFMLILDCETNFIVERFHRDRVQQPEAFNQYNGIYNNIIVFIIDRQASPDDDHKEVRAGDESCKFESATDCDSKTAATGGELHIFQCVSHRAKQLVAAILSWKFGRTLEVDEQQKQQDSKKSTKNHKQKHQGTLVEQETTNDSNKMIVKRTEPSSVTSSQADKKAPKQVNQLAGEGLRRNTNNSTDAQQNDVSKESTTVTTSSPSGPSSSTGDTAKAPVVTVGSSSALSENVPIVNVNVKETVQVFNQIAALREKGGAVNNNQTPSSSAPPASATPASTRPLSSEVSVAPSGQAESISRVNAALGGQFFKQRSIRATLAPKAPASEEQQQQQQGSSSADSSMTSSAADGKAASSSVSAGSSSSRSEPASGRAAKVPLPPPAPNHKSHHRRDGATEMPANGAKSNDGHQLNGLSYTQSSSRSSSSSDQRPAVKDAAGSRAPAPSGARLSNGHEFSSNHRHQQSSSGSSSRRSPGSPSQQQLEQVTTNESYVSVLNHCFDDIEKFIIRLQHAYAAMHELQAKRSHPKKSASGQHLALASAGHQHHKSHLANGGSAQKQQSAGGPGTPLSASEFALLNSRARGPNADDFLEILSKFKLAFNLLAKLKGCIHEPNAPELVHFLFTPLAIIIESARNVSPAVDPALVGIPYLSKDALDLLSNCCTSKESDLWISLGPNWTQTIEPTLLKASRLPSSFQPIFSDGWAPVISELELIGLVEAPAMSDRAEPLGGHYRSSRAICAPPPGSDLFDPSLVSANTSHKAIEPASIKSSISNQQFAANGKSAQHHKKRISPIPQEPNPGNTRQAHKSPYKPAGYLQEMATAEQSAYRAPKVPRSQRVARQPIEKGSRRHPSDAYAAGHFLPPPAATFLDDRTPYYSSGYPTNPSDDYTELQDDHLGGAGPSARRRQSSLATDYKLYDASVQPPLVNRAYPDRLAYLPGDEPSLQAAYHNHHHHQRQYIEEAEHEAMLLDLGPAQTEWFYELSARGALVVRVLFTRDANNDKELSVKRGEVLEILDDSRKWWKARNIDLQVAYVPHTIVAVMYQYQTLDELLTNSPAELIISPHENHSAAPPVMNSQHGGYSRRDLQPLGPMNPNGYGFRDDHRRNSKTSRGAFRYF